ncbi:MAG: hypothetical protein KGR26_16140, partial [Cyanobacteria bacterium REEB65]|nr:hypothetical protein [Cyanobacteria bacterium REEB65]
FRPRPWPGRPRSMRPGWCHDARALTMRVVRAIDRETLREASQRRHRPRSEGRIIVVHGAKGGSGASTLAANLTAALAQLAGPVALLDLALGSADQDLLWNSTCQLRLEDLLGPEGHELSDALVAAAPGVRLLAGPAGPAEAESIQIAAVRPLLLALAERHPYVVVDTSSQLDAVTVGALELATIAFVPLLPEITSLRATQRQLGVLDRLNLDLARLRLCLWHRESELNPGAIERVLGRSISATLAWAPAAAQEAINAGKPLALAAPKHPLAQQIVALAREVAGLPGSQPSTPQSVLWGWLSAAVTLPSLSGAWRR